MNMTNDAETYCWVYVVEPLSIHFPTVIFYGDFFITVVIYVFFFFLFFIKHEMDPKRRRASFLNFTYPLPHSVHTLSFYTLYYRHLSLPIIPSPLHSDTKRPDTLKEAVLCGPLFFISKISFG